MTGQEKERLLCKNQRMIDMVIERAKRDFPDDIALIGLTGSFSTGDFHEKSDLDLIIVNQTPRGQGIAYGFILGDVGYDIYCTPWEPRIEAQARLESPMASHLVDLQILYCAKQEYLEKFNAYRQRALDALAKPIGPECLARARKHLDQAKLEYASAMLASDPGAVRFAAGGVLYHAINALVSMNNTYLRRGIKRHLEEVLALRHLPDDFEEKYFALIRAKTPDALRGAALSLLRCVDELHRAMADEFIPKPEPNFEGLTGTYEELWCNYRNKVLASAQDNDPSYAFLAAFGAQNYLDEMTECFGTPKFELMRSFDADDLGSFKRSFLQAMDGYLAEYRKLGKKVEAFDTFEELYARYMGRGETGALPEPGESVGE